MGVRGASGHSQLFKDLEKDFLNLATNNGQYLPISFSDQAIVLNCLQQPLDLLLTTPVAGTMFTASYPRGN